jgi:uncharacterized RDD family membrane protein YckC
MAHAETQSHATPNQPFVQAGYGRRVAAAWVDVFVCYAASSLVTAMAALAGIRLALEPTMLLLGMLSGVVSLGRWGGRTPGKALWGLAVASRGGGTAGWRQVWLREGFGKWVILGWVPGIIGRLLLKDGWVPSAYDLIAVVAVLLPTLICGLMFRTTWYDRMAGTSVVRRPAPAMANRYALSVLTAAAVAGAGVVCAEWAGTGRLHSRALLYWGMSSSREHQDFLKRVSTSPRDYIFNLFERYDVVVLSERDHAEMTQWDFIFDLVKDPRFSERVGHVFTELGQAGMQAHLDAFMEAKGLSAAEVDERVLGVVRNWSVWPRWQKVNFPTYLRRLYALNQSLPPARRIHHHLTDLAVDWPHLTARQMPEHWRAAGRRDERMAQVIVEAIAQLEEGGRGRARSLVVMNYRHAFDLTGGRVEARPVNCYEYLRRALPGRVANVRINEDILWPAAGGSWKRAFAGNGNAPVGFDLAGSPFGPDPFDLFPFNPTVRGRLTYQDVFTGFVFVNPETDQYNLEGVPGYYRGWEGEMRRRAALFGADMVKTVDQEIALERQGRVPTRTRPLLFTVERWVAGATGLVFVPGLVLGLGAYGFRRRIQASAAASREPSNPEGLVQPPPRWAWALFAGAIVLSMLVHELGHCVVAWSYGSPAIPTLAKEYLLRPLPVEAHGIEAVGGVLGSVAALLAGVYWLLRRPDWIRSAAMAGAMMMPVAYTLRFWLAGRGHDGDEFQKAQSALGFSYSGHAVDWLFLALAVLAAAAWAWRTRPAWRARLAARVALGFILGLVIVVVTQFGNNLLFDRFLQRP